MEIPQYQWDTEEEEETDDNVCHDLYFSLFTFPLLFCHFSYFPHCSSTIYLCLASPGHCACFLILFIPIKLILSQELVIYWKGACTHL